MTIVTISATSFQNFAGHDLNRWRMLTNCTVCHKVFGAGIVKAIQAGSVPGLVVRFNQPTDSKTERVFSSDVFGRFFADFEAPEEWLETIKEAEREMARFKAGLQEMGKARPQLGGASRQEMTHPHHKPQSGTSRQEISSSGDNRSEEKVKCPYCAFTYPRTELVEHIRGYHPSKYLTWRSKVDPHGKRTPAPPMFDKNVILIKGDVPGGDSRPVHPPEKGTPRLLSSTSSKEYPASPLLAGQGGTEETHEDGRPKAGGRLEPRRPRFHPGQKVVVQKDPKRRGVVSGEPYLAAGEFHYEVFLASGSEATYRESDLVLPQAAMQWGGLRELLRDLALVKLNKPLSDNLYALYGSRTQFEVYQFKPALKFLGNPDGRLLIADEVGLGKTIEAGIIYLELQARLSLNRVLVVCPSGLRYKWQDEMKLRFDEEFTVLDTAGMSRFIEQHRKYGDGAHLRGIVSLEAIRREAISEAISQDRVQFDLVIIDEAHHCRNTGTLSNNIAQTLSENADAMLMLTATPLQIGNQDLFNLLRILSPGEFDDFEVFESRLEPNQYINRAAGLLATGDQRKALRELRLVERTRERKRFTGNPYYAEVVRLLEKEFLLKSEMVAAQRRLIELNTLAYIFTRTRKREIAEKVPTRAAFTLTVEFTRHEERFYERMVAEVRREFALMHGTNYASGWVSIMRERQTASCISAARRRFGGPEAQEASSSEEESFFDPAIVGEVETNRLLHSSKRPILDQKFTQMDRSEHDSKFEIFWKTLSSVLAEDSTSKVIVFSFFRGTIEYLYERLSRLGVGVLRLHGGFKVPDRQAIIDQFRGSPQVRVLISSDVGAEGLDFQFCNTLFNYDLPWNPMKVEQRIGRIDRFGQASARIRIYNLMIENSVESRILMRLYQRIGLFERAIGDIEAILGEEIRELSRKVYTAQLTSEEEHRLADQAARNILRRQQEMEEFEEKRLQFMGQEAIFSTMLTQTIEAGSFISEGEVYALVVSYLEEVFKGRELLEKNGDGTYVLNVSDDLAARLSEFIRSFRRNDLTAQDFARSLIPGKVLPITFSDQLAFERKLLHFITLRHPLAQAAVEFWKGRAESANTLARLGLQTKGIRPGDYFVFLFMLEAEGAEKSTRLVPVAVVPGENDVYNDLSNGFLRLVQTSHFDATGPYPNVDYEEVESAQGAAKQYMAHRRDVIEADIQRSNDALVNARLAALVQSYEAKRQRVEEALQSASDTRIRNMRMGQLRNLEARHNLRKAQIEAGRQVSVSFRLVMKAFVTVN
jgi:ERCC4-related helicase